VERSIIAEQLARYAEELRLKNAQMEADIQMAREIQEVFLPQQYPAFPPSALASAPFAPPAFPIVANATATPVQDTTEALRTLAAQLTAPVRWIECMEAARALAPEATFIEMGPGSVLSGLLRKILPGTSSVTLGTSAEVEAFLA
jgi:[acyl-carrier-protein] S-malonyltransferase